MDIAALHELFLRSTGVATDTRGIQTNQLFFALKGDNFNGNTFADKALLKGASYVVIDEDHFGKNDRYILVEDVLETLQKLSTYHREYLDIPILAITGSNGKTTSKELIHAVLRKKYNAVATVGNLNNHIGVPLTLLSMKRSTEFGIVEMGANHPKEIAALCEIARPNFGYITNFGKAHLEGFGSVEGVIKGKSEMYDYLIANNKLVFVNGEDPIQTEKTKKAQRFVFAKENQDIKIEFIDAHPFVICTYNNLTIQSQLIGDYNYHNIAVAIAIGNYFKVEDKAIKLAIENYTPTNNRSQILKKGTNKIILDAYNANPTSMFAALSNFEKQPGNKIAFLGDMFELGDEAKKEHQNIADLAISLDIDQIIFIGDNFYKSKIDSKKSEKYKSFSNFEKDFNLSEIKNATLLVKGSRGMALERVLDMIYSN